MKKILVLGGGFAGLESAIALRRRGHDVTLVTDRDSMFVYPISIWIPFHMKELDQVRIPMDQLARAHGFTWVLDRVQEIQAGEHRVVCEERTFDDFDELVVAMGASKLPAPGLEHTVSICGDPRGGLQVRDRLDALLERGSGTIAMGFGGNPKDPSAVRGGPVFELLLLLHWYLTKRKVRDRFQLHFFAPMASPGVRMGEKAVLSLEEIFAGANITRTTGKKISRFDEQGVVFEDGSRIDSDLTLFVSAGTGHPVLQRSDLPLSEAGFVRIDEGCQVRGLEHVWAVGDVAALEGPKWAAKQGHLAEVMARTAAYNIDAEERKRPRRSYALHINILCVMDSGNGAAWVYRDDHKQRMIPLGRVGHWLKRGWGWYYRASKLRRIPRLPGL
jgi:sulfide:quinone oxidoreductase